MIISPGAGDDRVGPQHGAARPALGDGDPEARDGEAEQQDVLEPDGGAR